MDVMFPEQRHKAMSHNRGRTQPERTLASSLWRKGLRYLTDPGYKKRYGTSLPGHPDLIFPKLRVVMFVDGCFWHGCPKCKGLPHQSGEFWVKKIEGNIKRDKRITEELSNLGWKVIRIPEHLVRKASDLQSTSKSLVLELNNVRLGK